MGERFDRNALPDWSAFADREGLTLSGRGRWRTTRCEFHGGSDSMRVNSESGGWICMACGAKGGDVIAYLMKRDGLDFIDAARRLGAWNESAASAHSRERPKSLAARDAMEVIVAELLLVFVVVSDIVHGIVPNESDWRRFIEAAGRVEALVMEYRS